ncbi:hypothetical protein CK203_046197 [Vitis vinifera]|uniref:Uncharacterized protein n=1 Tax=Vitis vinifera TaxID=29760 RepID=A0A438I4A6_VITVI|nr:hypothetical protein CK203_046197 [Vitis vinifera]
MLGLNSQLQKIKKESITISMGEPLYYKDKVMYTLNGLTKEYDGFVTSIYNRSDKPSLEKVHSLLYTYEYRLEQRNTAQQLHFPQSCKLIHLKHILHTPQISKQLISVTKLCFDNQAFVEFHLSHFLVKDQASRRVLLQGILENGLCKVSSSITLLSSLDVSFSLASPLVLVTQLSFNHA